MNEGRDGGSSGRWAGFRVVLTRKGIDAMYKAREERTYKKRDESDASSLPQSLAQSLEPSADTNKLTRHTQPAGCHTP